MPLVTQLAQVWGQPDRFASMTDYIAARGLQTFARISMGTAIISFTVVGLAMLASESGPTSDPARAVSLIASCITLAIGLFWLVRWPTRRQSYAIVVGIGIAVTLQLCAVSNPWVAVSGAGAFAFLAGYVATLHGVRVLVAVVIAAVVVIVVGGVRLGAATDPIVATMLTLSLVGNTVLLPLILVTLIPVMQLDAQNSDVDSLTKLLNRRGFDKAMDRLLSIHDAEVTVTVMLIDLDDFKHLNDTAGHAAGDEVLRHVGATLHGAAGQLCGRVGGEEFVVVLLDPPESAIELAERHRRDIADNPWGVTASIGMSSSPLAATGTAVADRHALLRAMLDSADRKMYRAKREGGDRVCSTELSPPDQVTSSRGYRADRPATGRPPAGGRSPHGLAR